MPPISATPAGNGAAREATGAPDPPAETAAAPPAPASGRPEHSAAWFGTTHWSVVLSAGASDPVRARTALEELCRTYWPPLYAYARRRGYSPEDAQDLTQGLFLQLLSRHRLAGRDPRKGRFRAFLLASMNHFLADEWDKACAQKRGHARVIPMALGDTEARLAVAGGLSPEQAYDHAWAITLLETVYSRLEGQYRREGKAALFAALRPTLTERSGGAPYASLAPDLNLSPGAIKVAVHRLRRRYRDLLRQTIAETVATPEEVEDELRYLLQALSGP